MTYEVGDGDCFQQYSWSEKNEFFMWSTSNQLAMGGGGDGFGFVLDEDFLTGGSSSCETFSNEILTPSGSTFRIVNVEVWGLENSKKTRKTSGYKIVGRGKVSK